MHTSQQTAATRSLKALYIGAVAVVTTLTLIGQAMISQQATHIIEQVQPSTSNLKP